MPKLKRQPTKRINIKAQLVQNGLNGQKWTEWNEVDQIKLKWIEWIIRPSIRYNS